MRHCACLLLLSASSPVLAKNLAATLDLLELNKNGTLDLPSSLTHTVIEIGSNGHSLLWETPFSYRVPGIRSGVPLKNQSHVMLLSFEPLLDKYAWYLTILKRSAEFNFNADIEKPGTLGWSVPGRAIVLPYAVGPTSTGYAEFHVAKFDGCSSLLPIDPARLKIPGWDKWRSKIMIESCGQQAAKRRVPVIPLEHILETWLPGRHISLVKIDAQGYDMHVAMSAGAAMPRINAFELEVTGDATNLPYQNSEKCTDVSTAPKGPPG